jgi:molybdopterin biosynthesis enzyme
MSGPHSAPTAASCPADTSPLKANRVAVERGHGNGSMTVMDCGGSHAIGEGARSECYVMVKERAQLWVGSGRDEDDKR